MIVPLSLVVFILHHAGAASVEDRLIKYGYMTTGERITPQILSRVEADAGLPITGRMSPALHKLLVSRHRCSDNGQRLDKRSTSGLWRIGQRVVWRLSNTPTNVSRASAHAEISAAARRWAVAARRLFTLTERGRMVDIDVSFRSGAHNDPIPFDGPGGYLAHTYPPSGGNPLSGDVHLDDTEPWHVGPGGNPDSTLLYNVILHEFGHALGLGHSSRAGAVMYPWYADNGRQRLGPLDRKELLVKYGAARPRGTRGSRLECRPVRVMAPCDDFDSATQMGGVVHLFRDSTVWRFDASDGGLLDVRHLRQHPGPMDAVVGLTNGSTLIFSRRLVWLRGSEGGADEDYFPRSLQQLGLPRALRRVDAAFALFGKIYLTSGWVMWTLDAERARTTPAGLIAAHWPHAPVGFRPVGYRSIFGLNDRLYFLVHGQYWDEDGSRGPLRLSDWLQC